MRIVPALATLTLMTGLAHAAPVTTLGSFATTTTGSAAFGSVGFDAAGNLYGTTSTGGTSGGGSIFTVTAGAVVPLVSFAGVTNSGPYGGLTYDASSNTFYGAVKGLNSTTNATDGQVFSYVPGATAVTTLKTFTASGSDGSQINGPITVANGKLYGSTTFGSGGSTTGQLFTLGGTTKTDFTPLANFAIGGTNGSSPSGRLVVDAAGNISGTTAIGGAGFRQGGNVFRYTAATSAITNLYSFATFGANGTTPRGGLSADAAGSLYGTTTVASNGGQPQLFKITPDGTYAALATFVPAITGTPGNNFGNVIVDAAGTLYGTSATGGANGFGTVWKYFPGATTFEVLYTFTNGLDGGTPTGGLTFGPNGLLYGTTSTGGVGGSGTVFSTLTPEPTSLALVGLGAAGLLGRRRKH